MFGAMFSIPVCYLISFCLPDAVMRQDVAERFIEIRNAVRLAHNVGVQRDAHDTTALCSFLVKRVERILDHCYEVRALMLFKG